MNIKTHNQLYMALFGIFLAFLLRPAFSGTGSTNSIKEPLPAHVSMIELLGQPAKFNGRRVVTEGVFEFGLSQSSLFASRDWYKNGILKDALVLRLNPTSSNVANFVAISGKYVVVEGTFNAKDCGELCQYTGAMVDISVVRVIAEK